MKNREFLIAVLSDENYDPFDNGADGESVIYYNISCPYFRGDERARCKDQIEIMNRKLCVECKMDWLNAEVDP